MKHTIWTALICAACLTGPSSLSACADGASDGTGRMELALRDGVGGWLRLRIFREDPGALFEGAATFDTNCLDAKSRTYDLTNIDAGANQWVVIEGFNEQDCNPDSRVEVGYRGNVEVVEGSEPRYYHVPLYEEGGITTLPEGLNISASLAKSIELCDAAADTACPEAHPGHTCYDALKPEYWCVPSCTASSDCARYHPRSSCQASTGWCVLNSPHPLNLAEPRALGHGGTLSNGDAVFLGGFGKIAAGRLLPGNEQVEVFDQRTGLFERRKISGLEGWSGAGLSGYAAMGNDRFAIVGGVASATISYSGSGEDREVRITDADELSDQLVIVDMKTNTGGVTTLPRPLAESIVVRISDTSVLVMGGRSFDDLGAVETIGEAWLCDVAQGAVSADCQPAGELAGIRAGGDAICTIADCSAILVVGGRNDAYAAEVVSLVDGTISGEHLTIDGPLGSVNRARLCGSRLVGGATGDGVGTQAPVQLTVAGTTLEVRELGTEPLTVWPAVGPRDEDGDCWIAGGIGPDGNDSDGVYRMTDQGSAPNPLTLSRARFGAVTAWVSGGPIGGALLYGGGLMLTGTADSGAVDIVRGVEVLKP